MASPLGKKRQLSVTIAAAVVFLILLNIGFNAAEDKRLWTDEIFSQLSAIESLSYSRIAFGFVGEGNTSPLFYLIQRAMCDTFGYRAPESWRGPYGNPDDPFSRVFLRIPSVLFMSLALVIIFYYFARQYSLLAGVYSLLVSLSSFMIWAFWAEARPYALWVFLTTAQSLLFLYIISQERHYARALRWLTGTHILLSLTAITAGGQIIVVSFLLWLLKEKNWRRHIFLTAIPVGLCLFYYSRSVLSPLRVPDDPMHLIRASIPEDRILIFALYAVGLFVYYLQQKKPALKAYKSSAITEGKWYLALIVLMLVLAGVYIVLFKFRETPAREGLDVPIRQFIFLAPVGIIAATLFSVNLVRAFKDNLWMRINIVMILAALLIIRFLGTYTWSIERWGVF